MTGDLLTVGPPDTLYFAFQLINRFPRILAEGDDVTNDTQFTSDTQLNVSWAHLAYTINNQWLRMYINDNMGDNEFIMFNLLVDSIHSNNVRLSGIGYNGFIYGICFHQMAYTGFTGGRHLQFSFFDDWFTIDPDSDCGDSACTVCPMGVCLIECKEDEYMDEVTGECMLCLPECVEGCMRPTDCRMCDDPQCMSCPTDYDACEDCLDSAAPIVDGECVCPEGTDWSLVHDECRKCADTCITCPHDLVECIDCEDGYYPDGSLDCAQCIEACATCRDDTNKDCDSCNAGSYLIPHSTICADYCPSALEKDDENHICLEEPQKELCYTWNSNVIEIAAEEVQVSIAAETKPVLVEERGLFFSTIAELTLPDLILNPKFTLEFIVRPEIPGDLMTILTDILRFDILESTFSLTYGSDPSVAIGSWTVTTWYNIAVTVDLTQVQLFINNEAQGTILSISDILIDTPTNLHVVGRGFQGLMYSFCVYQYIKSPFVLPDLPDCGIEFKPDCVNPCGDECEVRHTYCFEWNDKTIDQSVDLVSISSYSDAASQPIALPSRGLYFDGDDLLQLNDIILDPEFAIEFWIRPNLAASDTGALFTYKTDFIRAGIYQSSPSVRLENIQYKSGEVLTQEWTLVAWVTNQETQAMYVNGVRTTGYSINLDPITDEASTLKQIGENYTGFIYSFCIKQQEVFDFELDTSPSCDPVYECTICPPDTCLSNCENTEYIQEDKSCDACLSDCTDGCIRATDCRLCNDELCEDCDNFDTCEACIPTASLSVSGDCECTDPEETYSRDDQECGDCREHCLECEHGTLDCTLCVDGRYVDDGECSECIDICATCEDGTNTRCPTCAEGYYQTPNTQICEDFCPSALNKDEWELECLEIPHKSICYEFIDNDLELEVEEVGITIPQQSAAPYTVYQRGVYFPSSGVIALDDLILNTRFTLEYVIRPESVGDLLSIQAGGIYWLRFALDNNLILAYIANHGFDATVTWQEGVWQSAVVKVDLLDVQIILDNVVISTGTLIQLVIDNPSHEHSVGKGYTGFIYKFCIHQYIFEDDFALPEPVPTDCDHNQTNPDCEECLPRCEEGCIRTFDCRPCVDSFCEVCTDYEGPCEEDSCMPGATYTEGNCTCDPPRYYQIDIDVCAECTEGCCECSRSDECITCCEGWHLEETNPTCVRCDPACEVCDAAGINDCSRCSDGFYHVPDTTTCTDHCPTGYTQGAEECEPPAEPATLDHCIVFSDKAMEISSPEAPADAVISTRKDTDSSKVPDVMYNRGIYFDGNDILYLDGLILNTTFTLEFWIRPDLDATVESQLFSINTDYAIFDIHDSRPSLRFNQSDHTSGSKLQATWTNVSFVVQSLQFDIYIDGSLSPSQGFTLSEKIIDLEAYTHVIGTNYSGFIYSICLKNRSSTDFNIDPASSCTEWECSSCPTDTCISECDYNQYVDIETTECFACQDDCVSGCMRSTDCRNCMDELCQTCLTYDTCEACIQTAEFLPGTDDCTCSNDWTYDFETQKCGDCPFNCAECEEGTLDCTRCFEGYYFNPEMLNTDLECSPCSEGCRICSEGPDNCPECKEPYYKLPNMNTCQDFCPSALQTDDENRLCLEEPLQDICFVFEDKNYEQTVNTVSIGYTGSDENAPVPAKDRGIFLAEATVLDLPDLVLNTKFSVEFMIRPDIAGDLLTVTTEAGDHFLTIDIRGNTLNFQLKEQTKSHETTWAADSWYSMAVYVDLQEVRFYINNEPEGVLHNIEEVVVDSPANIHTIGTGYEGLLYKFCVYQYVADTFDTTFPPNCGINETYLDGVCEPCDERCPDGCVRTTDCNPCDDYLCADCEDFSSICEPEGCIENAVLNGDVCECNDPNYYQIDLAICAECVTEGCEVCSVSTECEVCKDGFYLDENNQCQPCNVKCDLCTSADVCTFCSEGFVMQPDTAICEADCPSGYVENETERTCSKPDPEDELDFCFVYDEKELQLSIRDVSITLPEDPEAYPTPMLNRGIFFDGGDNLLVTNMILNNAFTVEFWICPYVDEAPEFSILTVGDIYADFRIESSLAVFTFDGNDISSNGGLSREWTQVVYDLAQTTLQIYINGELDLQDSTTITSLFIDLITNAHIVGTNFRGFMYSICLKNRQSTDFSDDPGLSKCQHDQYIEEDGSCGPCQEGCETGCMRPTDCRNCTDELCESCSEYDECQVCIPSAVQDVFPCACPEG